ncbi:uncharacterized protein UV8b_07623 [Ustilaginoidea virens]|uniref:Uncharacterized protein n=1 Tax=Ustilaginoidea virens TaxID=1159556 RepID=A0A8E5HXN7_USTVR|nr:uncharacterized protein UV8b_07623 [Ustilaginoidea virens]QUC23382.1 hypothetical protein UV8b_07623 [Ustilaginoidea virens]
MRDVCPAARTAATGHTPWARPPLPGRQGAVLCCRRWATHHQAAYTGRHAQQEARVLWAAAGNRWAGSEELTWRVSCVAGWLGGQLGSGRDEACRQGRSLAGRSGPPAWRRGSCGAGGVVDACSRSHGIV